MIDFAGYQMPIHYSGIIQEHQAVRNSCGMFDVSHMGQFIVKHEGAEEFLNYMTVNDVLSMNVGDAQYSAMCFDHGGIVDDILIYKYEDRFMLVVNAANVDRDLQWLADHKPETVVIENKTDELGLIAIQGPRSREILIDIFGSDTNDIAYYKFKEIDGMTVGRTGYTGELGFEIYGDNSSIDKMWDKIIETGDIVPCGLGCRDTLRLEMKFCLYGNDINEKTNPIEAGLGWITKLNVNDFIGKNIALQAKQERIRHLAAFEMVDRAVPRKGYVIYADGEEAGIVTSGTQSPTLNKGIGMGYVQFGKHKAGMSIEIDIRGKMKKAVIVKPPFYKDGSALS